MQKELRKTVSVPASKPYEVIIGRHLLDCCGGEIAARLHPTRVVVVSDRTVARLYGDRVCRSLQSAGLQTALCAMEPGEDHKTMETVSNILAFCTAHGLTRSDCIVALGGGITGDVAGFSAAIYRRGIPFVQLPTTFLAAIDASVGGKTGVNLPAGKNLAGAFWQPSHVLCDCDCFATLPRETFLDGVAEAVKYGMIADADLFEAIRRGDADRQTESVVERCVTIKSRFVAEDEFDRGLRQKLNLGHTFGHAIETCSGYTVTHGHAVAIGMVAAAHMANRLGLTDAETVRRLTDTLQQLGLPTSTNLPTEQLLTVMRQDKKSFGNSVTLILPQQIGSCILYPMPVDRLQWMGSDDEPETQP